MLCHFRIGLAFDEVSSETVEHPGAERWPSLNAQPPGRPDAGPGLEAASKASGMPVAIARASRFLDDWVTSLASRLNFAAGIADPPGLATVLGLGQYSHRRSGDER